MKLIAWNLGHRTRERRIRPEFVDAIRTLAPDVLVLNEYVHGPSRATLIRDLAALGLESLVSDRQGTNNQVLIASRPIAERGDLVGPITIDGGGRSNFLHVHLPEHGLEIAGVRVPAYACGGAARVLGSVPHLGRVHGR